MTSPTGTLVVVEGIDGSGKTTLAASVARALRDRGVDAAWRANRSLGPVRDTLDAIAHESGHADRHAMLGATTTHLLAACLKWRDLSEVVGRDLRPGGVLVLDRYVYTHYALAGVTGTDDPSLVRALGARLRRPDLTLFLDIDPGIALARVRARGTDTNSEGFLRRFDAAYRALPEHRDFVAVDADRPPQVVLAEALTHVDRLLRTGVDAQRVAVASD